MLRNCCCLSALSTSAPSWLIRAVPLAFGGLGAPDATFGTCPAFGVPPPRPPLAFPFPLVFFALGFFSGIVFYFYLFLFIFIINFIIILFIFIYLFIFSTIN